MAQYVREIMTQNPVTVQMRDTITAAARTMRDANIGDVVVLENGQIRGILTDRDIVVRALAEGRDPAQTAVGDICSRELTTLSPHDAIEDVMAVLRGKALRWLPVVGGGLAGRHGVVGQLGVVPHP